MFERMTQLTRICKKTNIIREDNDVTLLIVQSKSRASRRGKTNWANVRWYKQVLSISRLFKKYKEK